MKEFNKLIFAIFTTVFSIMIIVIGIVYLTLKLFGNIYGNMLSLVILICLIPLFIRCVNKIEEWMLK